MDVFNVKIYDDYVSGTQAVYTPTIFADTLGTADRISSVIVVRSASGTSPTITVQIEQSFDGTRWQNQKTTPELNGFPLTAGSDNVASLASDPSSVGLPTLQFIRLRIVLGGTSPGGIVQIWTIGRTPTS